MSITVANHLNFRGNARAALDFYASVFGGEPTVITYQDAHAVQDPAEAEQVMWGEVAADNGFRVMAYDVPSSLPWNPGDNAHFVAVRGDDPDQVTACWERLADGATVRQPLAPAAWSSLYGMLEDRFGVIWVLNVASAPAAD